MWKRDIDKNTSILDTRITTTNNYVTTAIDLAQNALLIKGGAVAPARGSRSSVTSIRVVSPSGRRFLSLFSALGTHSYGSAAPPRARAEWAAGRQQH